MKQSDMDIYKLVQYNNMAVGLKLTLIKNIEALMYPKPNDLLYCL